MSHKNNFLWMMVLRRNRSYSRKESTDTTRTNGSDLDGIRVSRSLATGEFSPSGFVTCLSPRKARGEEEEITATYTDPSDVEDAAFESSAASYLRVSDLNLTESEAAGIPWYHAPSSDIPPHVSVPGDNGELWVAVDNGIDSQPSPIATHAMDLLERRSLEVLLDEDFWTSDPKTLKLLNEASGASWKSFTFHDPEIPLEEATTDTDILIWTGKFDEGFGSDLPAIRSAAILPVPADELFDLLSDSSRVQEYNAMSLGRTDILTLPTYANTKVCCAESRPPMLRKTIRLVTLLHATTRDNYYQLSSRAVANGTTTHSEILMGTNVIRALPGNNACLLISVSHLYSNLLPAALAKRMGCTSATNFVLDIRKAVQP